MSGLMYFFGEKKKKEMKRYIDFRKQVSSIQFRYH